MNTVLPEGTILPSNIGLLSCGKPCLSISCLLVCFNHCWLFIKFSRVWYHVKMAVSHLSGLSAEVYPLLLSTRTVQLKVKVEILQCFFLPDSGGWLYVVLPSICINILSFCYQSLSRRRWMKRMRCWVRLKWSRPHQLSQSQPLWSHQLRENVDVLQRTSQRVSVQPAPSVSAYKSFIF